MHPTMRILVKKPLHQRGRPHMVLNHHYIVASGEADLAYRITQIPKALFA
jgi:hypothetical protein